MKIINFIFIIFIIIIIIYCLFSTSLPNNKLNCNFKHISSKNMLTLEIDGFYKIFNPSIVKYNDGYIMCVRYSNRTIKNIFMCLHSNLNYESHIGFVLLSSNMQIKKFIFPNLENKYLEDPRIFIYQDLILVSITEFNSEKNIYPALYIFDNNFSLIRRVEYNRDMYSNNFPIQKNWCLFSNNNNLLIHTDSYPIWNVYMLNHTDGNLQQHISFDSTIFFKDCKEKLIRCSTSWKSFDKNTYICGLHTKSFFAGKIPTIRTILVQIDKKTLIPIKKTPTFCIDVKYDTRIQFLSGLEIDSKYVYLTYGIGNYKIEIKRITKLHILSLLKYP